MKDINKLKNYREKYKRHYNIDFGSEYVVHHIDENKQNNDISNLLLLPRELHNKYHLCKNIVTSSNPPLEIVESGNHEQKYYITYLSHFIETIRECNKWYDYKLFLEGEMPNIHNINLKQTTLIEGDEK